MYYYVPVTGNSPPVLNGQPRRDPAAGPSDEAGPRAATAVHGLLAVGSGVSVRSGGEWGGSRTFWHPTPPSCDRCLRLRTEAALVQ